MRKVAGVVVVLLLALPAWAAVDTFKVTVDGSFNTNDTVEGYGNAGQSTTFRLSKANQHMGYMDWDGAVGGQSGQSMGNFISANGGVSKAYLYVHAAMVDNWVPVDPNNPDGDWTIDGKIQGSLSNTAAIVTLRTGNTGNIAEDPGIDSADFGTCGAGVVGTTQASAWREGTLITDTGYAASGDSLRTAGAQAWIAPSTRTAGFMGFGPGAEVKWQNGSKYYGWMYGDERYAVEAMIGGANSWGGNAAIDPTTGQYRFEKAGQLVNKNADNSWLMLGPDNAIGDGWYKVEINPAIVDDIAFNVENKGLVFDSYHNLVPFGWGNDDVDSKDGGLANAAYLEIVTPEPVSLTLLALGGLALLRRRNA